MKKILSGILVAAFCSLSLVGACACGNDDRSRQKFEGYSVYAPDGAPALSLVNAISKNNSDYVYHIVDASTIQAQVTGETPNADFCVLPLNLASKLLGTGETYQILGTVTNGNLFFLTTGENAGITRENLPTVFIGKTVGVVQLTNVPGLTLQAVLADNGIAYEIIKSIQAEKIPDKVNLINLGTDAASVSPGYGCDYYLCPEPAATTKCIATKGALKPAGNLQELYGEGNGYPQAVLVAKKWVITNHSSVVETLISYMEGSEEYLQDVEPATVLSLLADKRTSGLTPSFNANNLNTTVITNCGVAFTPAQQAKKDVNAFLEKLAASAVSDNFFYAG